MPGKTCMYETETVSGQYERLRGELEVGKERRHF